MNPADRSTTTAEETLPLVGQLRTLTSELTTLQARYRLWALEFSETGIPHEQSEFSTLVNRIKELKDRVRDIRIALQALVALGGGGAR